MADLSPDDLRRAVASGVIDEETAARLQAFSGSLESARSEIAVEDEPFEFFRGFGEIFIAVGLILLLGALQAFSMLISLGDGPMSFAVQAIGAGASWILAVHFTAQRRTVLPSIVLAVGYSYFVGMAVSGLFDAVTDIDENGSVGGLTLPLRFAAMAGLMALYYRVFRLPFALMPLALFALSAILTAIAVTVGITARNFDVPVKAFDLLNAPALAIGILCFGLATFALAMRFDMRDPHRVSRYAACAFWLHVVAAPAIVNTICLTLYNLGGPVGYLSAVVAFLAVAMLAVAIDRRSFLLSGALYFGLGVGYALEAVGGDGTMSTIVTVGLIGACITALGAYWTRIRAYLMTRLPAFPGKARLPPY